MFGLRNDETARNADHIKAAKWLGDRGWEGGPSRRPVREPSTLKDLFRGLATDDLEGLIAIYEKYHVLELVESGEVSQVVDPAPALNSRRR
jgi:hypothetical protein